MMYTQVMTKGTKRRPSIATEYAVNIDKGVLTVVKIDSKNGSIVKKSQAFEVGTCAEYDSYNLSYIGKITKITPNTVTIVEPYGSNPRVHRLNMYQFCWRNIDFDLDTKRAQNSETMMYI